MLKDKIRRVVDGDRLHTDDMADAVGAMVEGLASPAQVGAFLTALRLRGESEAEIAGAALALRDRCVRLPGGDVEDAIDTCGTGGDRSVSSRCGSADLLTALGVRIDPPPEVAVRCLREAGFAFLFAPLYHPAMKSVAPVRQELGIRTLFNLIGPLCNPAGVRRQVMGVYSPDLVPVMAGVLDRLGCRRGVVVSSHDGLDEISVCAPTSAAEVEQGRPVRTLTIEPERFGLPLHPVGALKGGSPEENAALTMEILGGARGACRDAVLVNAAAALEVAGLARDIGEGIARAAAGIDSGAALRTLERVRALSAEAAP